MMNVHLNFRILYLFIGLLNAAIIKTSCRKETEIFNISIPPPHFLKLSLPRRFTAARLWQCSAHTQCAEYSVGRESMATHVCLSVYLSLCPALVKLAGPKVG